ncbi:hypothetical protein [Saccharopolyspora taberi]|uniref:Uncharacterized protein n=1 Tax=Saccharopolyspora taberi TaxID=60895 RepID=A0ABN3VM80_9PSEU
MDPEVLRDGLRAAVADEPPLGFDPDDVVAEAARRHRRRRATAGAGVATLALVAVIAGAVPALLEPAEVPPAGTEVADAEQWPPPGTRPLEITREELRSRTDRVQLDWARAVRGAVPDAMGLRVSPSETRGPAPGRRGSAVFGLSSDFVRKAPGGRVHLTGRIFGPGSVRLSLRDACEYPDGLVEVLECRRKALPDGSLVVDVVKRLKSGPPSHELYNLRPDGTVVQVSADFGADSADAVSEPPLSSAELIALATDRRLTLAE